jgi:serine/threonine-protein phosphatase 2A catalytic subunit
LTENEIK